ncbi:uncharacterized protein At3g50808 [Sesamum indicum]|uniref:Uncharacterized protein At3g50808 n=1 Tax=Sesamum indicum TaxID=4182 RepID=A0A6I9TZS3_SESIN|nr:uncharacterized protein At3g50808 [Sesamum indicum]
MGVPQGEGEKQKCSTCNDFVSDAIMRRVYRAWRAAIDIQEIRKYIDVSGIQLYKINGKDIVFLNPNSDGSQDHHVHDPKCQICRRRIKESNYLFCSIACKNYKSVEYKMEIGEQQPMRKRKRKSTAGEGECSSARSMRKRSRKGIPRRAPFW